MQVDIATGRIPQARWLPSPNFDARPHRGFVNTLVVHAISLPPDQFGGNFVEDFFCNRLDTATHPYFETIAELRVSAHFYIRRSGELVQFVATHDRAWHAGISVFNGLEAVNDFSLGIELEGCERATFEEVQYRTLTELSGCLMRAFPAISSKRIVGHEHIAPGRKTDPGPCFDWTRYRNELRSRFTD